jgi:hypothetical protein
VAEIPRALSDDEYYRYSTSPAFEYAVLKPAVVNKAVVNKKNRDDTIEFVPSPFP